MLSKPLSTLQTTTLLWLPDWVFPSAPEMSAHQITVFPEQHPWASSWSGWRASRWVRNAKKAAGSPQHPVATLPGTDLACGPCGSYSSPRCSGSHSRSYRRWCCKQERSRAPSRRTGTRPTAGAGMWAARQEGGPAVSPGASAGTHPGAPSFTYAIKKQLTDRLPCESLNSRDLPGLQHLAPKSVLLSYLL